MMWRLNLSQVISTMDRGRGNNSLIADTSQEQSYDISPYKVSDDEDEDDDEPNNKFVPSWASKNRVALVVASQQRLDPEVIFPPGSFCSISEERVERLLGRVTSRRF
ncbi:titin-like protein [Gossypium australe]|uniref:Titin-like protein n=1 Tax=Gossypium australe TaxID=47621 RepID=A0A5B6VDZ1_9ROSI|nr:titin-like protein [Gossypium australe]